MLQADSEKLRQAWVQAVQASIASAYRESPDSCYSEVWPLVPLPDACAHTCLWLLQAGCLLWVHWHTGLCGVGVHVCAGGICPHEGVHAYMLVQACARGALACTCTSGWGGGDLLGKPR